MNYQKIYDNLISRAQMRCKPEGYVERHHIVPRCLGGGDEKSNMIVLTAPEHYLAHQLLVKIHPKNAKILFAAISMTGGSRWVKEGRSRNKLYGWLRERHSEAMSLRVCSPETLEKMSKARKGIPLSEEWKKSISESLKGIPKTPEHIEKVRLANIGKTASDETKARQSERMLSEWTERKILGTDRLSEEHKNNISKANSGKKRTDEQRANMSAGQKGKKFSDEHRAKLSAAGIGRKYPPKSAETRAKLSAALKGRQHSPETIAKMSATRIGMKHPPRSEEFKKHMSEVTTGKKLTAESIAKREATKARVRAENAANGIVTPGKKLTPESIVKREATKARIRAEKALLKQQQETEQNHDI